MESVSKSTQYTNIIFYFIKYNVIPKELNVKQCSTDDILAHFQETLYKESRSGNFRRNCWVKINNTRNQKQRIYIYFSV